MNILLISDVYYPEISGIASVAETIAEMLVRKGNTVTVCTKKYHKESELVRTDYIKIPLKYKFLWLPYFSYYFKKIDYSAYDLIILNGTSAVIAAGLVLQKEVLKKSVVLIHGFEVEWVYEAKTFMSKIFRYRIFHKRALDLCHKIVTVSNFYKNKFLKRTALEYLDSKIVVSYTGIDNTLFHRDENLEIRKEIEALALGREVILSVSRIVKQKGYGVMLDIFKQLLFTSKNYVWIIIGTGDFVPELEQLIEMNQLQNNVFLLGKKSRHELKYYYSCADCFWLLSDYDENLPLVYLEAQACGLPAIGWQKGGVVETIISGETGFTVVSKEECLEVLKYKEYKKLQKERLSEFVASFNNEKFIKVFK